MVTITSAETSVSLTAAELLLLRQRLSDGPGTPAISSSLDAKLYQAQRRLEEGPSEVELIHGVTAEAMAHPGRVVTVDDVRDQAAD